MEMGNAFSKKKSRDSVSSQTIQEKTVSDARPPYTMTTHSTTVHVQRTSFSQTSSTVQSHTTNNSSSRSSYTPVYTKLSQTSPGLPSVSGLPHTSTNTFRRPSYTPVYQRSALTHSADASLSAPSLAKPSQPNSNSKTKYDLSKKAYVLIFHNDKFKDKTLDRLGSKKDLEKIESFFKQYRCDKPDIRENYSKKQVLEVMKSISAKSFKNHSCIIVFIMSHGAVNDMILAEDAECYSLHNDVIEQCCSNPTLKDKPKLFFVQACRGDAIVADASRVVKEKSDIVIFQSSYQGTVSYRNERTGSAFIQTLLELLHEKRNLKISDVNPLLIRHFKNMVPAQTPTLTSTLGMDFIFGDLCKT